MSEEETLADVRGCITCGICSLDELEWVRSREVAEPANW